MAFLLARHGCGRVGTFVFVFVPSTLFCILFSFSAMHRLPHPSLVLRHRHNLVLLFRSTLTIRRQPRRRRIRPLPRTHTPAPALEWTAPARHGATASQTRRVVEVALLGFDDIPRVRGEFSRTECVFALGTWKRDTGSECFVGGTGW